MNLKSFINREILRIENDLNIGLLKSGVESLVKKEVIYGKKNNFILHSLEGGKKEIFTFSISYTFKEDVEDENGQRPNDITLSIILQIDDDKSYKLNREIIFGTGMDDIEFEVIEISDITNVSFEQRFNFDELRSVFEVSVVSFIKLLQLEL
ncbi:hypothetical protein [Sphingobacterium sp. GVS05A]|uniref:hypothetical protein n=1 Tax=Sphingobacterium TaxID=28453 RepID=UPI001CC0EA74|nr:hypothetical protein [Sphingobacterium sp. GVS05A]